jgi:serine/threonine protein kinase
MYGSVRLASDGLVVKRGVITQAEQRALQRLDGTGLTPGIKAVALNAGTTAYGKGKNGFVVMDRAKGDVLTKWINDGGHGTEESREVFSAMLRARKELHSRGIAHNDMHAGNVFWDGKRMMVIDFGMARINPTAALIEGLGTARGKAFLGKVEEPGDYQSRSTIQALNKGNVQSGNPDWKRFKANRKRVEAALRAEGGAAIIERSIRSVPKYSPITPARAAELVQMLYEGL